MKYKARNYYNFDHAIVAKNFAGKLSYMGDVILKTEDRPVAVYKSAKPNKRKGHKKYMLLQTFEAFDGSGLKLLVRGMDPREMTKHRTVHGRICLDCSSILVSLARHDFQQCGCPNEAFVGGGSSYLRCGARSLKRTKAIEVDLLTGKIS